MNPRASNFLYSILLKAITGIDAEKIHHLFLKALKFYGKSARGINFKVEKASSQNSIELFGLKFSNRVGLAAGLDKNGEALEGFQHLDFSFIEVGTVTPKAQDGNPKPRLFRSYKDELIFNAMGFNNHGVEQMKHNIEAARPHLRPNLILGINIGKNAITPLEDAWKDYAHCARELKDYANYLTVNVSSPNTKGLRGLQNFSSLSPILEAVFKECTLSSKATPVLVKIAPEMDEEIMAELITETEKQFPVAGWILTNTLQRDCPFAGSAMPVGGVSGAPLKDASLRSLLIAKKYSKKVLVSSGGILSFDEAKKRLDSGASLIQIYSGLIFKGPQFISELSKNL